jgi:hypothetical protein
MDLEKIKGLLFYKTLCKLFICTVFSWLEFFNKTLFQYCNWSLMWDLFLFPLNYMLNYVFKIVFIAFYLLGFNGFLLR